MSDTIELNISDLHETLERMSAVLLATEANNKRLRAALQAALDLMVIDYDGYPAVDMARAALADQGKPETLSQG